MINDFIIYRTYNRYDIMLSDKNNALKIFYHVACNDHNKSTIQRIKNSVRETEINYYAMHMWK